MIVWYKHTTVNLYYIYVLMAFPTKIEQCSCKIQNHQRTIVLNKNSFKVLIRLHIIPSCTMGKQCDKYNDYLSEVVQFCGFKCPVGTNLGHAGVYIELSSPFPVRCRSKQLLILVNIPVIPYTHKVFISTIFCHFR